MFIGVRLVVSAALLTWILRRANVGMVLEAARSARIPLLLAAYAMTLVGVLVSAERWRGLLRAHGVSAPRWDIVKSVMVGAFFNNFLPSTVGGDAMRAYDSYRMSQRPGAMTSVVVDRLLGLLVLTMFALVSVPFDPGLMGQVPLLPFWIGGCGFALVGLTWLIFLAPPFGALGVFSRVPTSARERIRWLLGAFDPYRGQRGALWRALGWSLVLQTNVIIYYVIVARAMGFTVPVHHFFLIVPLALFVLSIPITVNGIGLRENVLALFLAAYGIGNVDAVGYAWLVYLGSLGVGLLGGIVYAVRPVESRAVHDEEQPQASSPALR